MPFVHAVVEDTATEEKKAVNQHYIMRRRGHYFSQLPYKKEGAEWCKSLEHSCYRYTVTIISPIVKDEILIHHERIVKAIEHKKPTRSCENMAKQICEVVRGLLNKDGAAWNVIHVKLIATDVDNLAMPKANMEFVEYKETEDVFLLPLLNN